MHGALQRWVGLGIVLALLGASIDSYPAEIDRRPEQADSSGLPVPLVLPVLTVQMHREARIAEQR